MSVFSEGFRKVGRFGPHLDILPEAQQRLWQELHRTPDNFVLYGGTAVALRYGHRNSVDFDFFSLTPFSPDRLLDDVGYLAGATVRHRDEISLTCDTAGDDPVKVSFFHPPNLRQLAPAEEAGVSGVWVAAPLDLAATKMTAVQARAESKDYLDVHTLTKEGGLSLEDALAGAQQIYGNRFAPMASLAALTHFEDGDLRSVPESVQRDLQERAAAVDLEAVSARGHDLEPPEQEQEL